MRKTVVLACALVCLSPSSVNGQEESWVILRVKQHRIEKNTLVITLLSSQQITVPAEDIKAVAQTLPSALSPTVSQTPTPAAPALSANVKASDSVIIPTPDAARPSIAARCGREWPKDATKRLRCEAQQQAAIYKMWGRIIDTAAHGVVRNRCAAEAPDDFVQQDNCEAQHMPPPLPRAPAAVSSDDARIRSKCAAEWPDDYVMQKYCFDAQVKARATIIR